MPHSARIRAGTWMAHPPQSANLASGQKQEHLEWVVSFERRVRELLLSGETKPLIGYENKLGTRTESEDVSFPVEGVDGGSISMLAVRVG